jgi:hypothetical protein
MSDMNAFAEALIKDRKSEFERLQAKHDRLRAALEETTALIENMVSDLDTEFLLYYSEYRPVLKQARAALAEQEVSDE